MQLERKSSIEKEPRTLSFSQIQYAREAALYVINNNTIEEALSIFTEGLKPVVGVSQEKMMRVESEEEPGSNSGAYLNLPSLFRELRDVATAPF